MKKKTSWQKNEKIKSSAKAIEPFGIFANNNEWIFWGVFFFLLFFFFYTSVIFF